MQFFERARELKKKSHKFIAFFVMIYFAIAFLTGISMSFAVNVMFMQFTIVQSDVMIITVTILVFMFFFRYLKKQEAKSGSSYVLSQLGAIEVDEFHDNPLIRRYYKIVTEISIAAAIKRPDSYLIPTSEINALAVASNDKDAAIAITEGALTRLSEDELAGLVAHEMSHILHHDCILNFNLATWLYGLQCVYFYGRDLFYRVTGIYPNHLDSICIGYTSFYKGREEITTNTSLLYLLYKVIVLIVPSIVIMMMGFSGAISARIIKAMIVREREYLADAEAVRFTRSKSLANVLKKIAILETDSEAEAFRATREYQEFTHFYLADYNESLYKVGWFDTHPPIFMRIKAIDPYFVVPSRSELEKLGKTLYHHAGDEGHEVQNELIRYATEIRQSVLAHREGIIHHLSIEQNNQHLINGIAVFYAIIIAGEAENISKQQTILKNEVGEVMNHRALQIYDDVIKNMGDYERIQYLILMAPDFLSINDPDLNTFREVFKKLIVADQSLSILEYCAWKYLEHIDQHARSALADGLVYSARSLTIVDLKVEAATFFNVLLNEGYGTLAEKKAMYHGMVADFAEDLPYREKLSWYKELETVVPILQNLTVMGADYLSDQLEKLYESSFANDEVKSLIHVLIIVIQLRLPTVLRYDKDNGSSKETVARINTYQ